MEPTGNIPEPEWAVDEPSKFASRAPLLIGLGALVIVAAVLAVAKSARDSAGGNPTDSVDIPRDADWESSFRHLADAMSQRLDGINDRLHALELAAFPVEPRDVELATDLPAPIDAAPDAEPLPAPSPAHVSVPDIEGRDA